jgi:hypothetical protein
MCIVSDANGKHYTMLRGKNNYLYQVKLNFKGVIISEQHSAWLFTISFKHSIKPG